MFFPNLFRKVALLTALSFVFFLACTNSVSIPSKRVGVNESATEVDTALTGLDGLDYVACSIEHNEEGSSYKPLTYKFSILPKPSNATDLLRYSIVGGDASHATLDIYNKSITFSNPGTFTLRVSNESGKISKDVLFEISSRSAALPLSRKAPLTAIGSYKVKLYSFSGTPNLHPSGDAELYIGSNGVQLLLNGGIFSINSEEVQALVDSAASSLAIAEKVMESLKIAGEPLEDGAEGVRADTILEITPTQELAEALANSNGIDKLTTVSLNLVPFVSSCGEIIANNLKSNSNKEIVLDGEKSHFSSQLALNVESPDSTTKELEYVSDNEDVVKVTPSGLIKAIKNGKANVTASIKGVNAVSPITFSVEVKNRYVERIAFIDDKGNEITKLEVKVGDTPTLKAVAMPRLKEYENLQIEYRGSNITVASINRESGSLKANREGSVKVSAFNKDFEKIYLDVTVLSADYSSDSTTGILAISNVPSIVYIAADGSKYSFDKVAPFPKYAGESCKKEEGTYALYNGCFSYELYKAFDGDEEVSTYLDINFDNGTLTGKKYEADKNAFILNIASKVEGLIKAKKEVQVFIEEDVVAMEINGPKKVYVGTEKPINDDQFKDKKDSSFYITATPLPEGAKSNTDFNATVIDSNIATIVKEPNDEYKNRWKVTPLKEGEIVINVKAPNGVEDNISIASKEVINIQGYYRVTDVGYKANADATNFKWFTINNNNKKRIEGEFVIYLDKEGKKVAGVPQAYISGRVQYTPSNPRGDYQYNELRYQYFTLEHTLDPVDKYANLTREALKDSNILVDNSTDSSLQNRLILITKDSRGNDAHIYIQKKSDKLDSIPLEENVRVIKDNTIYVTPIDLTNDVYSMRGYYVLEYFFHNVYANWLAGNLCTQANFSHRCAESKNRDSGGWSQSDSQKFGYEQCGKKYGLFACEGGSYNGDGAVKWFKGEASIFFDPTEDVKKFDFYTQHRVQYGEPKWQGLIGKQEMWRYMYIASEKPIWSLDASTTYGNNISKNGPVTFSLKSNFKGATANGSFIYYKPLPNDGHIFGKSNYKLLHEMYLNTHSVELTQEGFAANHYHKDKPLEGGWTYRKVSDRPSEIDDGVYDTVQDRNKPATPELSIVKDLYSVSGTNTPLTIK